MRSKIVLSALVLALAVPGCRRVDRTTDEASPSAGSTGAAAPAHPHAEAKPAGGDAASPGGHGEHVRPPEPAGVWFEGERHLANVRQLTFGGQNAEAYWAPNGRELILQATPEEGSTHSAARSLSCDQIYILDTATTRMHLVSTGKGRTTCAYFLPGTDRILYSSTHAASPDCPPPPDHSRGYVWPIEPTYEIYSAKTDGSDLQRLTNNAAYDAEATTSVDGQWIVFTSTRGGDLDLWKMRPDGSDLTQLTNTPGYDGGAFFSHDGKRIVYRASRPEGEALTEYQALLAENLVRPSKLDIYWMNADGTNVHRVTENGAANFAPYFTPDDQRILFASNVGDPRGRNFDLWIVNVDGTGLEQVTTCSSFDSFPMFSPNGRRLAFASNRNGSVPGETNIFVADWVN